MTIEHDLIPDGRTGPFLRNRHKHGLDGELHFDPRCAACCEEEDKALEEYMRKLHSIDVNLVERDLARCGHPYTFDKDYLPMTDHREEDDGLIDTPEDD